MLSKVFMVLSLVLLASCSKEVSNKNLNLTPSSGSPSVSIPNVGSYLSLNFANHATILEDDDQLTFTRLKTSGLVDVPQYISTITFSNPLSSKPNLNLYLNQSLVCVYVWVSNKYQAHPSCYHDLALSVDDILHIENIPRSQTVSLDMLVK